MTIEQDYISRVMQNISECADRVAVSDERHPEGISYRELGELSGQVYTWLKDNGIGREDIVMINLPRGIEAVVAMIGVWRAGAAFTIVEEGYPEERTQFIYSDCECVLRLTSDVYKTIIENCVATEGFEPAGLHDAACVIYTSGTTGTPKGILHERGKLDYSLKSTYYNDKPVMGRDDILTSIAPLNFVGGIVGTIASIGGGSHIDIASYDTIRNPALLKAHLCEVRTTVTFMTAALVDVLKKYSGTDDRKHPFNPEMRALTLGAERISNIWFEDLEVYNVYAQTESMYYPLTFKIDRPYANTPVGRSSVPELPKPFLVDLNEGNGELCLPNPYCRGYVGSHRRTELINEEGLMRSGDIAAVSDEGDYIILGRSDDMVKINGNRVEPGEIESAVCRVLGIERCAARAFQKPERSFVCAYYCNDIDFDEFEIKRKLSSYLPEYMIPSHFMKLDSLPLGPTGKLRRTELPEPELKPQEDLYEAPVNEAEEIICKAFSKVLGIDRIGRNDDFYQMGGDSIRTMMLVSDQDLKGVNARDVFRERTAHNLAAYLEKTKKENTQDNLIAHEMEARKKAFPLTAFQRQIYDTQMMAPESLMWVLPSLYYFENADRDKLLDAVNRLKAHTPVFGTVLTEGADGEILQRYAPELITETVIEQSTEAEIDEIRANLSDPDIPFEMLGHLLAKIRMIETEKGVYIFFLAHHVLLDAMGGRVLQDCLVALYDGREIPVDFYYSWLESAEEAASKESFRQAEKRLSALYDGVSWTSEIPPACPERGVDTDMLTVFTPIGEEQLQAFERKHNTPRTGLFAAVIILALAAHTGKRDILINWVYSNRGDSKDSEIVGLLIRSLALGVRLNDIATLGDALQIIKEQIILNMAYSEYEWCLRHPPEEGEDRLFYVYEGQVADPFRLKSIGGRLELINMAVGQAAIHHMTVNVQTWEEGGISGILLVCFYIKSMYREEDMKRFEETLQKMTGLIFADKVNKDLPLSEILEATDEEE